MQMRLIFSVFCVLLVMSVFGCTRRGPKVEYVEGVVTQDGKPVEGALVRYIPKDENGISANGMTDANGIYHLTAGQGEKIDKGAVAGEYLVTISKYSTSHTTDDKASPIGGGMPSVTISSTNELLERYGSVGTSGLTATVKKGRNTIDFNLTQ
jgi:hypothetical protein